MRLGVIGCGNMGAAIVGGMLESAYIMESHVLLYDIDQEKAEKLSLQLGTERAKSIEHLLKETNLILFAVKPGNVEQIISEYRVLLDDKENIIISIAAGVRVELFRQFIKTARVVRVMPNTPALIGEGATGLFLDGEFTENESAGIVKMFESCGKVETVQKESLLDAVTGLSGSGPAYVFMFINALADGGVLEGLSRETAKKLAIQTVLGAAKLAEKSAEEGIHLEELKDKVTSPGGTTAEALLTLEKGNLRATVIEAVRNASRKAGNLGGK